MGQQISMEDAFPVYRKRCGELFDETLVLRAQVEVLEKQLTTTREENERLQQAASEAAPVAGGPDLAAQPSYPGDERD
jgi:prefoldin subunit 5